MRYARPSLRRYSVLESIAESSGSSNMFSTPPMKPFTPRRATITSFCVNVPVNQRPIRRASLIENTEVHEMRATVPPSKVYSKSPPQAPLPQAVMSLTIPAMLQRVSMPHNVAAPQRPSMKRLGRVSTTSETIPVLPCRTGFHNNDARASPCMPARAMQPGPLLQTPSPPSLPLRPLHLQPHPQLHLQPQPASNTCSSRVRTNSSPKLSNQYAKRRRVVTAGDELPSYARPTAASQAKASSRVLQGGCIGRRRRK